MVETNGYFNRLHLPVVVTTVVGLVVVVLGVVLYAVVAVGVVPTVVPI